MNLGEWLQDRRMKLNLSVAQVSERTGLSIGTIRAYEQERRRPTVQSMNQLLVALDFLEPHWVTPTIWNNPDTGELYSFARYPGDNRMDNSAPPTEDGPLLGLATTEELFRELITRLTYVSSSNIEKALVLAEMLGSLNANDREYRTAEPKEI